ncbi:MAG: phosphatase PAP2 family protein [Gemmatimonadetes bacterium]|nr:phosphatase PAP2 family protein [Gemmatimonadota bacterium]
MKFDRHVALAALVLSGSALLSQPGASQAPPGGTEHAGDVIMMALPVLAVGTTLALEDHRGSRQFLIGFVANASVTAGLKILISKDRPDGSDDDSFPSGHTSIAFQSASFIHLRYGLRYGAPAYAAAALVGHSRVHSRRHFVEDVVVGAMIGTVSSLLSTARLQPRLLVNTGGVGLGATLHF